MNTQIAKNRRDKLKSWIDEQCDGLQARFVDLTGINQGELSGLLSLRKSFGEKKARTLESQAGMPIGWLDQPVGEALAEPSNVTPALDTRGRVPVISWVQAGDWQNAVDNFHPGHAEEWVEITCPQKAHTFALRVKGDSMVSPSGAPSFPEGFILVVEPEMDFAPGDFVVAMNGDEEATFKQIVKDGGDWYLKPLNPNYRMKPLGNAKIVGVVREAILKFK